MKEKKSYLELFLFSLTLLSIGVQLVAGENHLLSQVFNRTIIACYLFFAGQLSMDTTNNVYSAKHILLKKAGIYYLIFLVTGALKHFILYKNNLFWILSLMITGEKIPGLSELFFTISMGFLLFSLIANYIPLILKSHKYISIFVIIALCTAFIPNSMIEPAYIGVFFGCNTYNCIPILPYCIYFVLGAFIKSKSISFSKKTLLATAALCIVSCLLIVTPLKPLALVIFALFPVYVIYYFTQNIKLINNLFEYFISLLTICFKKAKHIFTLPTGRTKKDYLKYFFIYTILFCIVSFLVFYCFIHRGKSIIWMHDAIAQYVPRVHYFINYMHNAIAQILQGNFNIPMYDFSIGLGNAVSFSFEPLYWLYLLFDPSNTEFAYNFVLVFRYFVAGISMSVLLLYFKHNYFEALFGSIIYTFCGFAIYAGVLHGHFIVPLITLPLLIIATEELYQKRRWYLCTIFVALSLLSSYYFLYMSSLAMGLYFLLRFAFSKEKHIKNWKYFISSAFTFAYSYILGVLIGNFPLFTSFTSYVTSSRSGASTISTPTLFSYSPDWLTECFTTFISMPDSPGKWLKLGFVPFAYIAIVVLFTKKGQRTLKSCFVILCSFCLFPIAGFIFSGFSTITNRWCYIFAFVVSFICSYAVAQIYKLTTAELKILFASLIPYALVVLVYRDYRTVYNLLALTFLLLNYLIILFMNENINIITVKTGKTLLLCLCSISLCFNAFSQYTYGNLTDKTYFPDYGTALDEIKDTPLTAFEDISDSDFYRVSTPKTSLKNLSSSLVSGYNGITMFSSTIDDPIVDYNNKLGNTDWNLVQLSGFDNRTLVNELACIKYVALTEDQIPFLPYGYEKHSEKTINDKTYHIYENKYVLPFGYCYSDTMSEETFDNYSASEKQEIMLHTAIVEDTNNSSNSNNSFEESSLSTIELTGYETDGVEVKDNQIIASKEGASITLHFNGIPNSETILEFKGQIGDDSHTLSVILSCDNLSKNYMFRSSKHTYYTGQDTYISNLGYREDALNSCTIVFLEPGALSYDSFEIKCQSMDTYAATIAELQENSLENIEFTANKITGNISVDENELLVFSMPYQKGWTAYIDGNRSELIKANIMYTGLQLEPGDHEIELVYEQPGLNIALKLSILGTMIFIVSLLVSRKRTKINKDKTNS